MKNLPVQDITSLYVIIDDCLEKKEKRVGRNSKLSNNEMITMVLWGTFFLKYKCIKDMYNFMKVYHRSSFPNIPDYSNFIRHCHRIIPLIMQLIKNSFNTEEELLFVDSTMVQVCKKYRADSHKVAKAVAAFGKNHQGWHYGFKLHATVNTKGQFCSIHITPANIHDAQVLPYLVDRPTKVVVGDGGYNARVMRERLWKERGVFVLAPPHPKQRTKLMTQWQHILLKARPRIESAFDYLKEHLHLVSSFPRSITGYLFHYLRVILAYQFLFTF